LSERHKAVLLELYETYVREHRASQAATQTVPPAPRTPGARPSKESA